MPSSSSRSRTIKSSATSCSARWPPRWAGKSCRRWHWRPWRPDRRRRGIGSALVRGGLDLARARDWRAVIVLGHQGYYPRFGFSAALAHPLKAPFSGDAFMALELAPGALQGEEGRVTYPPAFGVTNS